MATHYTLEKSYALPIGDSFTKLEKDPDVIKQLLKDTRSEGIRRSYDKDLRDFFKYSTDRNSSCSRA